MNNEIVAEEVQQLQGGWGHNKNRLDKNGERRWGNRVANLSITVGETFLVPYGSPAKVVNMGTEEHAVFNFYVPQGKPGEDFAHKGATSSTPWFTVDKGLVTYVNPKMQGLMFASATSDIGAITGSLSDGVLAFELKILEPLQKLISLERDETNQAIANLKQQFFGESDIHTRVANLAADVSKFINEIGQLAKRVYALEKEQGVKDGA